MRRAVEPEVTGWYSASVTPVRAGWYEVRNSGPCHWRKALVGCKRRYFDGVRWTIDTSGEQSIMGTHHTHQWRGIRKWVLVRRNDPVCGGDVYVAKRTPHSTHFGGLANAISFATKEKAESYRNRGRPFGDFAGIEAVLP